MQTRLQTQLDTQSPPPGTSVCDENSLGRLRRFSSKKSAQPPTAGRVYPQVYTVTRSSAEPSVVQMECLARNLRQEMTVEVSACFLQLISRELRTISPPPLELAGREAHAFGRVSELCVDGRLHQARREAVERKVKPSRLVVAGLQPCQSQVRFYLSAGQVFQPIRDQCGRVVGAVIGRQEALQGMVEVTAQPVGAQLFKIRVNILNQTPMEPAELVDQETVLMRTFACAHTVLHASDGEFVSMTHPPEACREAAAQCRNSSVWPVLVGDREIGERHTLISSPVMLSDYPEIGPGIIGKMLEGTELQAVQALRDSA
jgi:hypothetical protein